MRHHVITMGMLEVSYLVIKGNPYTKAELVTIMHGLALLDM